MSDSFVASELATLAASIDFAAVPEAVRQRILDVITDTVCVIGHGAQAAQLQSLRASLAGGRDEAPATLLGTAEMADPLLACLMNASASTVYQLDEGHRVARGHAAIHVVPAVLAAAEATDASGEDTCTAVLAGYEAAVRVGLSLGGMQPGLHPHGNWGTVGAAAGVARLLSGADAAVIEVAIETAASAVFSGYRRTAHTGVDAHYFFAGLGAQMGLLFGTSAHLGWSATPGSLVEFFGPRSGARYPATVALGPDDFAILDGYVKRFPTCAHAQGANDAVAALVAQGVVEASRIDKITVRTYAAAAELSAARAASPLAARFSIPLSVAIGLLHGSLGPAEITAEALEDPAVLALADKVEIIVDPEMQRGYPAGRPTVVEVALSGGDEVREFVRIPLGDSAAPLPRELMRNKWLELLSAFIISGKEVAVLEAMTDLPTSMVREMFATMREATVL